MIFNLIRNGQFHQGQQKIAKLSDCDLGVRISGAVPGTVMANLRSRSQHLDVVNAVIQNQQQSSVLRLIEFRPEIMIMDIESAVTATKLFTRGLSFAHFTQDMSSVTGADIMQALLGFP